ncbi:MAG: hypothetical protein RLZZ324_904 [Candidatus Parcubacteria bacterium]|jgi:hypothetical protein
MTTDIDRKMAQDAHVYSRTLERIGPELQPFVEEAMRDMVGKMRFDPMPGAVRWQTVMTAPAAAVLTLTNWHMKSGGRFVIAGLILADAFKYGLLGLAPSPKSYLANLLTSARDIAMESASIWSRNVARTLVERADAPVFLEAAAYVVMSGSGLCVDDDIRQRIANEAELRELPAPVVVSAMDRVRDTLPPGQALPETLSLLLGLDLHHAAGRWERRKRRELKRAQDEASKKTD